MTTQPACSPRATTATSSSWMSRISIPSRRVHVISPKWRASPRPGRVPSSSSCLRRSGLGFRGSA
ncbi:hypothetical protein ACFPRL_25545 [Pseudoclavibacter helvolus]